MSRYWHITKRDRGKRGNPWQVLIAERYIGCFPDEEAAARAAAKELGVSKASLRRSSETTTQKKKTPKRTHKYVYWHRTTGSWQVKIGASFHGRFHEHEDALLLVVEKTGLTRQDLELSPNEVRKSVQGQRNMIPKHMFWFQKMFAAYGDAYPGDLCDLIHRASQRSEIMAHANFVVPMMLAKFGPHRDALNDAFLSIPKPENDPDELRWAYDVLVAALVALNDCDQEIMEPWLQGPGRQGAFHSGLVVYANCSLKILKARDEEEPPRKKSKMGSRFRRQLVFGKTPRAFLIQPYSQAIEKKLKGVRDFGLELLKVVPPNSLEEWQGAMSNMTKAIRKAPGLPKPTCYRYKWVVRGFWDYKRRLAGLEPGIAFGANATVISGE